MRGKRLLTYLLSRRFDYGRLQGGLLFAGVVLPKDVVVAAAEELVAAAVAAGVGPLYERPAYVTALLQERHLEPLHADRLPKKVTTDQLEAFLMQMDVRSLWPQTDGPESVDGPLMRAVASVVADPEIRDAVELMVVKGVTVVRVYETLRKIYPPERVNCSLQDLDLYASCVVSMVDAPLQDRQAQLSEERARLERILFDSSGILDTGILQLRQVTSERLRLLDKLEEELESLQRVLETGTSLQALDLLENQLKALTTRVFNNLMCAKAYNPELLEAYAKLATTQLNVAKEKRATHGQVVVPSDETPVDDLSIVDDIDEVPLDNIPTVGDLRSAVGNDNCMASTHGGYLGGTDPVSEDGDTGGDE